jgi:hypothetical protein
VLCDIFKHSCGIALHSQNKKGNTVDIYNGFPFIIKKRFEQYTIKTEARLKSDLYYFNIKSRGTSTNLKVLHSTFLLLAGKKLRIMFRILVSLNPYIRGFMNDGKRRNSIEIKFMRF